MIYPSLKTTKRIFLGLFLMMTLSSCGHKPPGPPPFAGMPVEVTQLKSTTVTQTSEYLANMISRHSVTIQPQVAGQVTAIYVKAGDHVAEGTPLLLIDPSKQQAIVNSSAAAAQASQAQIAQAQQTLNTFEQQRQANLSNLELSQKNYARYRTLYAQQSASQQDLEKATDTLNRAQADVNVNQAQIAAQRAAVVSARKNYQQAQAAVREQQVQLHYYRITAPYSGFVGDIPVKVGDYVQPMVPLLSITQNNTLEANISVPSENASDLTTGLPVEIVDSHNQIIGTTHISFISSQVDNQTQTILVKAILPNPGGRLKTDQLVKARVIWRQTPGIHVPTSAVAHLAGLDFVFVVVQKKGKPGYFAQQRPVVLGEIEGTQYVVIKGLQPGETIVTSGIQKLADGAPVIPKS